MLSELTLTRHDATDPQDAAAPDPFTTAALDLYDRGLNPFPVRPGKKSPHRSHNELRFTRLPREALPVLCPGSNLAVMAGLTSGNLFILDCDSQTAFTYVDRELSARGLQPWVRTSTRGGHFWFRCRDGEVKGRRITAADLGLSDVRIDIDVRGQGQYALAPPSAVNGGDAYRWRQRPDGPPPLVGLVDLDFLPLRLARPAPQAHGAETQFPRVAQCVLVDRDIHGYHSHSEAEFAACLSLIGKGYSDAEIRAIFEERRPPHFSKKGLAHFDTHTLAAAHRKREGGGPDATGRGATVDVAWAKDLSWPGQTGATDWSVFLALCERRRCDRKDVFRASRRELAELSGRDKNTVGKSLDRLAVRGLVRRVETDSLSHATLYEILRPEELAVSGEGLPTFQPEGGPSVSHDAWHRRAWGPSGHQIVSELLRSPGLTVKELADRTGRGRSTVGKKLAQMAGRGCAHRDAGHRWTFRDLDSDELERIAAAAGTLGRGERRKENHERDRARQAVSGLARAMKRVHFLPPTFSLSAPDHRSSDVSASGTDGAHIFPGPGFLSEDPA